MKKRSYLVLFIIAIFWPTDFFVLPGASAEDFYRGKTIHVIVGAPAGGGYDTYARAIARHLSKQIPGNPSMVIDNKDGHKITASISTTLGHQ